MVFQSKMAFQLKCAENPGFIRRTSPRLAKRSHAEMLRQHSENEKITPTLESLDNNSLLHILQYLNCMDVVSVANTCPKFLELSAVILPKKSEQVCISRYSRLMVERKDTEHTLGAQFCAPPDRSYAATYKLESLASGFTHFGEFVKDLSFELFAPPDDESKNWRSCMTMMRHCGNLTTLHITNKDFTRKDTHDLQSMIERFEHLTELDFGTCTGLTDNWRPTLNGISTVRSLSLSASSHLSDHFVAYFSSLRSLTINYASNDSCWHMHDYVAFFDRNASTLRHLKLSLFGSRSVCDLITSSLPHLESLSLRFRLNAKSMCMLELPRLKALDLNCNQLDINEPLQTLSKTGTIEELKFTNGFFVASRPLRLPRLQIIHWIHPCNVHNFVYSIVEAEMPDLHTLVLEFNGYLEFPTIALLDFVSSKKSLKLLRLLYFNYPERNDMLRFFRRLIGILEEPCTPKRPVLTLEIGLVRIQRVEVSKMRLSWPLLVIIILR